MSAKPTPSETRYVQSGDILVAYQVFGDGPRDLVIVPGFVSHIEQAWEDPSYARFLQQLSSFSRVIFFDKRGTGMSERAVEVGTLEQRMDDVRRAWSSSTRLARNSTRVLNRAATVGRVAFREASTSQPRHCMTQPPRHSQMRPMLSVSSWCRA